MLLGKGFALLFEVGRPAVLTRLRFSRCLGSVCVEAPFACCAVLPREPALRMNTVSRCPVLLCASDALAFFVQTNAPVSPFLLLSDQEVRALCN